MNNDESSLIEVPPSLVLNYGQQSGQSPLHDTLQKHDLSMLINESAPLGLDLQLAIKDD